MGILDPEFPAQLDEAARHKDNIDVDLVDPSKCTRSVQLYVILINYIKEKASSWNLLKVHEHNRNGSEVWGEKNQEIKPEGRSRVAD